MPPARSRAAAPHLLAPLFRASHGPSSDCTFPVAAAGLCHSSPEELWRLCRVWKRGSWEGELQGLLCLGLMMDAQPAKHKPSKKLSVYLSCRVRLWQGFSPSSGRARLWVSGRGGNPRARLLLWSWAGWRSCVVLRHRQTWPWLPTGAESSWLVTPAGSHQSYLGRLFFFLSKYDN